MKGNLRIVGLGDSTTAGTPGFLSPLEAPPNGRGNVESQYAYWMMKLHSEWVVLNRGINGQRSDEIRARLDRDVLREKPDYAIILAGVNDVYQQRPMDWVKVNLLTMYKRSVAARIRTVAATILPYDTMSRDAFESVREINRWVQMASHELEVLFCDTNSVTSDPSNPMKLRSSNDGLHPDPDGYRRMGEALTKTIEEDLSGPRRV